MVTLSLIIYRQFNNNVAKRIKTLQPENYQIQLYTISELIRSIKSRLSPERLYILFDRVKQLENTNEQLRDVIEK